MESGGVNTPRADAYPYDPEADPWRWGLDPEASQDEMRQWNLQQLPDFAPGGRDFMTPELQAGVDTMPGALPANPWEGGDWQSYQLDPLAGPSFEKPPGTDTLMTPGDPTEYYLQGVGEDPHAPLEVNPQSEFEARGWMRQGFLPLRSF